ncbi:MAG: hypothetical protein ACRDWN_00455 [Acidimicrobiales bacterium]
MPETAAVHEWDDSYRGSSPPWDIGRPQSAVGRLAEAGALSDVWSHRDRLARRILVPDLAQELGIPYNEAYHAMRRLGLAVGQHPTSHQYHLTSDAADALRAEHKRIQALHRRSMKLAAAARQLKVALGTAALLSRTGQLEVDPETDSSGARFVTRTSVGAYWLDHRRASSRGGPAGVPIREVARFTGLAERDVLDLLHDGVLQQATGRRAREVTVASLRTWMVSRTPDEGHSQPLDTTVRLAESPGQTLSAPNVGAGSITWAHHGRAVEDRRSGPPPS